MPRRHVLAAALVAMVALTGCATQVTPRASAEIVETGVDCTTYSSWVVDDTVTDAPAAGEVPDGFAPTTAVRCGWSMETVDLDDGRYEAVLEETFAGDLTELLAALAEPNDTAGPFQACTADAEIVPDLWLVDRDGTGIRVSWPTDSCGKTKAATHDALADLDPVSDRLVPRRLIESREALELGCATTATMPAVFGPAVEGDPPVIGDRACVYTADVFGNGEFERVVPLSDDDRAAVLSGGSPTACAEPVTAFATFPLGDNLLSESTSAELDGCRRLIVGGIPISIVPSDLPGLQP